jgi:ABC-type nitrate/sulfonate/bicarbonate transport system substrate-binding protein
MPTFTTSRAASDSARALRVGFIALTDAAPLAVAEELGLFSRHGLRVELSREIGWATIRDKIIYGELDAVHALAPLLWSAQLGLGCAPCDVVTALVLNLHGNALTLSNRLWQDGARDAASLRQHARERRRGQPLTFGVVFPLSSHHLLLRDWLRAGGMEPERDVRIVTVPPAQMFRNLSAGTIDGFCAGEPWNSLAVRENAGWCPTWSAAQTHAHPEKVLMVKQRFAESRRAEHSALVAALAEACAWCDEPQNRERVAEILSQPRYLNLPVRVIAPSLLGRFDCGHDRIESVPRFHVFHGDDANVPSPTKAVALQRALGAAGLLSPAAAADPDLPRRLFRDDLHRDALIPHHEAISPTDLRGVDHP